MLSCSDKDLLDKTIKTVKHHVVDFPEKFRHIYPNKFDTEIWDVKVSIDQAFIYLHHGIDAERKMIITISPREIRRERREGGGGGGDRRYNNRYDNDG